MQVPLVFPSLSVLLIIYRILVEAHPTGSCVILRFTSNHRPGRSPDSLPDRRNTNISQFYLQVSSQLGHHPQTLSLQATSRSSRSPQ
ncbi:hypothetical protein C8R46DRAFT_1123913 [Mycena filopes]|nr:hypothetical protein C8R46DRAFT_1123913 [Mycena filopes]